MAVELSKNYVTRINLKTGYYDHGGTREGLISHCLGNKDQQYVVIGWSDWYNPGTNFSSYQEFYDAVRNDKNRKGKFNTAFGLFKDTTENDLFWTRDLAGIYWICRSKGPAEAGREVYDYPLDIGAVVPVEAYPVGTEVPGQIKASFNRPNAGIVQRLWGDKNDKNKILEYSKYIYNLCSHTDFYKINKFDDENFLDNLPAEELEELVITYLQIEKGYYVLSNSIANKSTTVTIECELCSREEPVQKAVVQVKSSKYSWTLYTKEYKEFLDRGYLVYLHAPHIERDLPEYDDKVIVIGDDELKDFVNRKGKLLPDNIMMWKDLFSSIPEDPDK